MFKKILIANRGEIAVRIIRACREMGATAVAVYSEADEKALHVRMADEAYCIGPAPSQQSYLSVERILDAARQSNSEAIHPGYGFLSENAAFAQAVQDSGFVFIGPSPHSIQAMGNKAEARQRMLEAGVPIVPGYQGKDDEQSLHEQAAEIGYPVLVKAAAGGGGKGMRVVWKQDDLTDSISAARREAMNAFGDERLILERYIPHAHHVEIQILGDSEGHLVHLFERECSVQRRYQKIIEETPSPLLDEGLRARMGAAAVAAAQSIDYQNAGTVEFIVNPESRDYYFLEMNTRLQVEHPITEAVTGLDLVQWQIRIAAGEKIPFQQAQLTQRGHAIECRLYAEDPSNGFLPAGGKLLQFHLPKGPGVRMDTGFTSGDEIKLFYDPLIAKLIVSAENREAATRKMQAALKETVILGMPSNWQFLRDVLADPEFETGNIYTTWVEEHFREWQAPNCVLPPEVLIAAALAQMQPVTTGEGTVHNHPPGPVGDPYSPWRTSNGFRTGE